MFGLTEYRFKTGDTIQTTKYKFLEASLFLRQTPSSGGK